MMLAVLLPAFASTYIYSGPAYAIPDGNPNGVWSGVTVNGEAPVLADVTVTLNLSGGYNGDLYAYLSHDGMLVPLLNRVGVCSENPFGSDGPGMNAIISDAATINIHAAGDGYLSGTYLADGQNISPLSGATNFNAIGGAVTLDGTFGGLNPNGNWTLFFADVVSSGSTSTLNNWSLSIVAIPEPQVAAFFAFGLVIGGTLLCRLKLRKYFRLPHHPRHSDRA